MANSADPNYRQTMPADRLTPREMDVLGLLAEGLSNRQIATRLTLEISTVKWYARQLYNRLGVNDRRAAVARAIELGLLAGPEAPAHNLPAQATPFVGREQELARLEQWLADTEIRLITITGPGGIGKTRLALAAAERELERRAGQRYADGIWFIPLADVSDAEGMAPAVAASLGLQFNRRERTSMREQLLAYLSTKRCLLLADNFEHLRDGAGLLSALLASCSGVQLLVTSRERLQLQSEQLLVLEGLEMPAEGTEMAGVLDAAAARLFLNTVRRAQPDFEPGEADAPYLGGICRAVSGTPLAIELAAAWAAVLPVAEIAAGLERNLDFLAAAVHDRPARHQSMRAALDASWQRLTAEQQVAFERLCVFRGGCTRRAALEVAGASLPLLVQLVTKSWLVYERAADRYRVHELIRQYGSEKLAADPELAEATRAEHSAYYAARLEERAADFTSGGQMVWVAEMQAELANIEQAWEWAVRAGDVAKIGRSVESLGRFYEWVGRLADGEAAMRRAAARLAELARGQQREAEHTRTWVKILIWQSRLSDDPEGRLHLLTEAHGLLAALPENDVALEADRAFLLLNFGDTFYYQDRQSASESYAQALALYQALADGAGMAASLYGLGLSDWARGHYHEASQRLEACLLIRKRSGDEHGVAEALDTLALVRKHQGELAEAERLHREVVERYQQLGSRVGEMLSACDLAHTLAEAGKYKEMLEVAQRAAAIASELGGGDQGYVTMTVARALQHLGRYDEAQALLLESTDFTRDRGFRQHFGFGLGWLGEIALVTGENERAAQLLHASEAILSGLHQHGAAIAVVWLSAVRRRQGEPARAEELLARARRLMVSKRSVLTLQAYGPVAALIAADQGELERACELHALSQSYAAVANSRWFYDATGGELEKIVARLPAALAEAAIARGQAADAWEVVERASGVDG